MGKIHVHIHKRTVDAPPFRRPSFSIDDIAIGGTVIYKEGSSFAMSKAVSKSGMRVKLTNGKEIHVGDVWSTDYSDWSRFKGQTADHRLDFKPDTDADRRARIQEVMRACGVTHMVALRWLEAEEWITDTCIRELKHAMKLGFTVDAADPVAKMDDEVRAAYAKLCEAFTAGMPGIRQLRSDFIAKVYAYGKKAGRDHPLARVMDSAAPTKDRGYSDISSMASMLMRQAQRIANLANGDGDAGDVQDMRKQMSNIDATIGDLRRAVNSAKPLITEK